MKLEKCDKIELSFPLQLRLALFDAINPKII